MVGSTWEYTSIVTAIPLWPSSSCTTLWLVPKLSRRVADVCLRSWNRIVGSPARSSNGLNDQRLRLFSWLLAVVIIALMQTPSESLWWRRLSFGSTRLENLCTVLRAGWIDPILIYMDLDCLGIRSFLDYLTLPSFGSHRAPRPKV